MGEGIRVNTSKTIYHMDHQILNQTKFLDDEAWEIDIINYLIDLK